MCFFVARRFYLKRFLFIGYIRIFLKLKCWNFKLLLDLPCFLKKYSPSLDVCDGNLRVVWAVVKSKQQPVKNLQ